MKTNSIEVRTKLLCKYAHMQKKPQTHFWLSIAVAQSVLCLISYW